MALLLTQEQTMLQEAARDFLRRQAPVSQLRLRRDEGGDDPYSAQTWSEMSAMGWPAMAIPEEFGGLGFGFSGLGIVLEEAGRTLTASPLISSAMMAVAAILRAGKQEQQAGLLPAIASGACVATLAVDEAGNHAPGRIACTAESDAQGYRLSGTKRFVQDGTAADLFIVSAMLAEPEGGGKKTALFLAPAGTPGLRRSPCRMLDTHVAAELRMDGMHLPGAALLASGGTADETLEYALDCGRIGQCAELLGVALEAFERSITYLKERRQFGVPIGSFQALQHRCAVLFGQLELCKSLLLSALQQLDAGSGKLAEIASMTKAKLAETAMKVTAEAIQFHGGIGMTDEFDIGFFYKRARILESLLGDRYFHLDRYAIKRGY